MGELAYELNRLAGTSNLDAQGAANVLAGTTGKDLVGAMNTAAGTTGLELNGAIKAYAAAHSGSPLLDMGDALDAASLATAPGAPTIGTAVAGDTQATANWTAPASNGGSAITGYQVKTYDSSGTLLATNTVGVVLTYTKTGLTNGTDVKFKVAAINAVNAGAQSAFSNTVTPTGTFDFAGLFTKGAFNVDAITGHVDGDPISPWVDASALAVDFVFDPTWGSGTKPVYKTNIAGGGTKPVARCVHPNLFFRTLPALIPQPFTILWVGRLGTNAGAAYLLNNNGGAILSVAFGNYLRMIANNPSGGPCTDLSVGFHYILAVFDGASSVLRVDGTPITLDSGSPGANGLSAQTELPGDPGHNGGGGDPDLRAYGVAPIHPSAGQITAIETFAAGLL